MQSKNTLVLHIRLTTRCNAECDYCSAYDTENGRPMAVNEFMIAVDKIIKWISNHNIGYKKENLTIQYLGGELLTMPKEMLAECVNYARQEFGRIFKFVRDGAQTNMIGSGARFADLVSLFGPDRVGTSVDSFTNQRKVAGSDSKYRKIVLRNQNEFKALHGSFVPGILVVDKNSLPYLQNEIEIANKQGYHLTLRPVFEGGKAVSSREQVNGLIPEYIVAFKEWAMKSKVMIQPFYQLLASRLGEKNPNFKDMYTYNTGCPFQSDCAMNSLDLEPNGDVYVCMDMADSKQLKLGNALTGEFDIDLWEKIKSRKHNLAESCQKCDYVNVCQGGCMSEALHHTQDMFGKTEYCDLWKALFAEVDKLLLNYDNNKIAHWLNFISVKNTPRPLEYA
jgi:radical SAM protein with 4Fe4S-binding SPASM domain